MNDVLFTRLINYLSKKKKKKKKKLAKLMTRRENQIKSKCFILHVDTKWFAVPGIKKEILRFIYDYY